MKRYCLIFCEKYNLRRRIAGNLLANLRTHLQSRTQVHSFRFALIYLRPCITLHPPTGNRQFRAQLFQAGKSDKITFSKIKFFTLKNRGNSCFLINYGISVNFAGTAALKTVQSSVGKDQRDTVRRTEWIGKIGAGINIFRRKYGDIGKTTRF